MLVLWLSLISWSTTACLASRTLAAVLANVSDAAGGNGRAQICSSCDEYGWAYCMGCSASCKWRSGACMHKCSSCCGLSDGCPVSYCTCQQGANVLGALSTDCPEPSADPSDDARRFQLFTPRASGGGGAYVAVELSRPSWADLRPRLVLHWHQEWVVRMTRQFWGCSPSANGGGGCSWKRTFTWETRGAANDSAKASTTTIELAEAEYIRAGALLAKAGQEGAQYLDIKTGGDLLRMAGGVYLDKGVVEGSAEVMWPRGAEPPVQPEVLLSAEKSVRSAEARGREQLKPKVQDTGSFVVAELLEGRLGPPFRAALQGGLFRGRGDVVSDDSPADGVPAPGLNFGTFVDHFAAPPLEAAAPSAEPWAGGASGPVVALQPGGEAFRQLRCELGMHRCRGSVVAPLNTPCPQEAAE
mmetsp:Transcript_43867/g.117940  ORF Transcript_43867/g.117940 Transcript_43867/m.117940 type:complete len:414 (+) Transcript_43867:99-1340(+)